MAKKQTRNQSGLSAENVDGNVDKIREILFGGQMRDYEQRFADLETRLTKNIELISSNFDKRMDRLDTFAKRELEKLTEQVKDERKARREDGKQGSRELKETGAAAGVLVRGARGADRQRDAGVARLAAGAERGALGDG